MMVETTDVDVPIETSQDVLDRIEYDPTDLVGMITSLNSRITTLQMQNSEFQARLLEAMTLNKELHSQLLALKKHIEDSTKPPLFLASVLEVNGAEALIRQHGNNQEWLIERGEHAPEVGARVAVNSDLKIIRTLPMSLDERALVMEMCEDPGIEYDAIGGLAEQIQDVRETVELPLTSPELFESVGVEPPRGVLLYGEPGTGKTLLAKAVAHHASATFIKMSGSELVHKYIGEGASLVRDVFQLAREKAPTILFVDEIDAVGARRTHDGTVGSGEVNRTMTQILTELDGFGDRGNVRVMAATNRIDLLDPALLRPGRFDRLIEIPPPDEDGRMQILLIHTKAMSLADDVDLTVLIAETEGATGADLKILATEAGMNAVRDRRHIVSMDDFTHALDKLMVEDEREPHGMFV